ncbi:PREDICTED: uncharacterized protein LOC103343703 [Prunus mume]|uniref:Uncharacterized protein LOC103343703 n=1 Tax=Prunus mume TaxID=102107 RepID=A0ABM0PWB0_PRUMU|nr:PREDICTED: uncharacterized protein LOC103343703 [Prunus mume]
MALPPGPYAIKSVKLEKYLLYTPPDGSLLFSGESGTDPNTTFKVEADKDHSDLVNIKSSNGKYWRRVDETNNYINSTADVPYRNQSSWQCTLFQITKDTDGHKYRIRHVQLGGYVAPNPENKNRAYVSTSNDTGNQEVFFEGS